MHGEKKAPPPGVHGGAGGAGPLGPPNLALDGQPLVTSNPIDERQTRNGRCGDRRAGWKSPGINAPESNTYRIGDKTTPKCYSYKMIMEAGALDLPNLTVGPIRDSRMLDLP